MNSDTTARNPVERAAQQLEAAFGPAPDTAMVLGSGLGGLVEALEEPRTVAYGALGLPEPSVSGHAGCVACGTLGGRRVAFLSGRIHAYEGRAMEEVVRAVRAMAQWGVLRIVLTNAVGAAVPDHEPGSLVSIRDHMNFMGRNPLVGDTLELGPRFPDLSTAYDPALRADAQAVAAELGISLPEVIYAAMLGPSYETPSEVRMVAQLGASTVGMSVVPEAIALAQLGCPVLALSMVSNLGAGLSPGPLHHDEVKATANRAGVDLQRLIRGLLQRWA